MGRADQPLTERIEETLTWCCDFQEGMFAPAHTRDGWTVEMHGLVTGLVKDLPEVLEVLRGKAAPYHPADIRAVPADGE